MEIQRILIDKILPNTWNPNHIKKDIYNKLKTHIKKAGAVLPVVLRVHPTKRAGYEIIDGYHRCEIYKELGHTEVDAVVISVSDERAKILTINLNYMRGSAKPMEYAKLIHSLNEKYTLDALELMLPESKPKLLDKLELLKLPGDMQDELKAKAAEEGKDAITTIHFQVTADEKEVIEDALKRSDKKKKGAALAELAKAASQVKKSSLKT